MKIIKLTNYESAKVFLINTFSSPTHWPDWNLVISKHYGTNFYYLGAYDKNRLIGICPIHESKEGFKIHLNSGQVYYNPYGGWIFNISTNLSLECTPLKYNQAFQGFTLPALQEFNVKYADPLKNEFLTLIIDLGFPYEEIFNRYFEHRVRKAIRKSIANEVSLIIENDLDKFYPYYYQSCKVRKLEAQTKDFFVDLFEHSKNIKFEISWAVYKSELLGYLMVVYDKSLCIGFLSYLLPNTPKLGQGDLLIAESIKHSQQFGCKYFDLCYIEKDRLPAIYNFKRGFSKYEVAITNFSVRSLPYRILNRLTKRK